LKSSKQPFGLGIEMHRA